MSLSVQNGIDADKLTSYEKRQFLPEETDLTEVANVEGFYNKLLGRDIQSSADLEQWMVDRSELESAIDQVGSILYIRMTCHNIKSTLFIAQM